MADDFDGYRKWLGIPGKKGLPSHYELLGLSLDEDDPDVIRATAEQRRRFVESKRGDGHDGVVTEILYRIGEAQATLLNAQLRRDYDRRMNLFDKRHKSRQVDPNGTRSTVSSQPGRTVGEESGIVMTAIKVMAVVCVGFGVMAWFSFQLPANKSSKEATAAQVPLQPASADNSPKEKPPEEPKKELVVERPQTAPPVEVAQVAIQPKPAPKKPIKPAEEKEPKAEAEEVLLLADDSLDAWQAPKKGEDTSNWKVTDGVLTRIAKGPSLRTKQTYRDFELHLEFKLRSKCGSGVLLRGRYEVQLLDSDWRTRTGAPAPAMSRCGAIYGQAAPSKDVYKGPNKWNTLDIKLVDDVVTVRMNETVIIDNFTIQATSPAALDQNESDPGPILLQSPEEVGQEFRNIRIKPIEPS